MTTTTPTNLADYEAIAATVQKYIDGAKTGDSRVMREAFHPDAWIFGWFRGEPFNGPIQILFDWDDRNGPAPDVKTKITSIDLAETVAAVRLEIENWTGYRFTDFFTLLKCDGVWKITNKVFHLHN